MTEPNYEWIEVEFPEVPNHTGLRVFENGGSRILHMACNGCGGASGPCGYHKSISVDGLIRKFAKHHQFCSLKRDGLRNRPGDQVLPTKNDQPYVHDLVSADILARGELGARRYGTRLQPFNGRNALQDAYEEALDLCCYLRQKMLEEMGGEGK